MCGRYALAADADELVEAFDLPGLTFDYLPRYNISPGQQAPVVAEDGKGRRAGLMTWGLVPAWRDEPAKGLVNARVESVADKPSFREAFQRRRCLVPADGFFEWRRDPDRRVPFWIRRRDGRLLSYAAIWERWARPGADPRFTFAILTTAANGDVGSIHDRMPVVVDPAARGRWLSRRVGGTEAADLLTPVPDGTFVAHEVSPRVNRADNDDPGLIVALDGSEP